MRMPGYAKWAAFTIVPALLVATWWIIGAGFGNELGGDPTQRPDDYDFMFRPPSIDPTVELVAGIVAVVVVVIAFGALVAATRSGQFDRRWWGPLTALAVAATFVGFAERVTTAAVVGANIGGGIVLLFGTPFVIVLVAGSAIRSIVIFRTTRVAATQT